MLDPVSPDELALALGQLRQSPSDEGAWRSIYSRLYPYVVAVAYRRVRDKTIAEDIAQEVFVRIARLRPFDRIDDPEHFRAYVWRMAINVAHSFARSVRRERDQQALWDQSGRRLAMMEGAAVSQGGHDTKGQTHVVPTKAMQLLERNLADPEEQVRVCLRPNDALFKTERAMIYSRLVEGRYPPYREVFPKKQTVKVPLVTGPFHAAVRQAAIMTDEESKKVVFSFAKKKLTLKAQGSETGRAKVELPVDYDGKGLDISFDPRFLTEMLRVLEPDAALTLELVDSASPALFRQGDNYSYVVMPLS